MSWFGKSFEEKVNEALDKVRAQVGEVRNLAAQIDDKVVTLVGEVPSMEVKTKVAEAFNALVETDNTFNQIRIDKPEPAPGPAATAAEATPEAPLAQATRGHVGGAAAPTMRLHVVESGDTLSGIAKTYYGKASLYMKIFEENRDQLDDPNLIKVGQKLRIPDLD